MENVFVMNLNTKERITLTSDDKRNEIRYNLFAYRAIIIQGESWDDTVDLQDHRRLRDHREQYEFLHI